jgi:hypothetical protein
MRLADRAVVGLMTPRTDVDWIDATASEAVIKERLISTLALLARHPSRSRSRHARGARGLGGALRQARRHRRHQTHARPVDRRDHDAGGRWLLARRAHSFGPLHPIVGQSLSGEGSFDAMLRCARAKIHARRLAASNGFGLPDDASAPSGSPRPCQCGATDHGCCLGRCRWTKWQTASVSCFRLNALMKPLPGLFLPNSSICRRPVSTSMLVDGDLK